ncbi:MAG: decarboxylating 6-phosphogluconate dehydrogenase [Candidatus Goldbacteria bacterium]|nr:decarboxylating 6-phosphogluconate dehydrogenase [Candidatus Goldiibacteriota bacterium]
MKLAVIGLGRMGLNMALRLARGGHNVVAYNRTQEKTKEAEKEKGIEGVYSLKEVVDKLDAPRVVWLMLPAGEVSQRHVDELKAMLKAGDIIVDGANSHYKDGITRAEELKKYGIMYVDAGVSGGVWGLNYGYGITAGGSKEAFNIIEPLLRTLSPEKGYLYCGRAGAGHYVKMVHNAIEYGMMEAYAEGFQILKASPYADDFDLKKIAGAWNHGSVIRSWMLGLLENAFEKDKGLSAIQGYVQDSGEARWALKEAVDSGVAADVIAASLFKRFNSRQKDVFANKITAALRNEFGGHETAGADADVKTNSASAGAVKHSGRNDGK